MRSGAWRFVARLLVPAVLVVASAVSSLRAQEAAKPDVPLKDARLAIIGDSITEQKMYSRIIETYLLVCRPDLKVRVMQFGWGGETAPGFVRRMDNDLGVFRPTVATTCYGMNDGGYRAFEEATGKRYQDGMSDIIKKAKAAGILLIVGSSSPVDSQTFRRDPKMASVYNDTLARLRDIDRTLAEQNGLPFADVYDALFSAMGKAKDALGADFQVCGGDGVHPGWNGHLVMAYAFLKAMGLDGNIGTITVDAANGQATATEGHKVLSARDGAYEIESSRYPFCFFGDEKSSNGTVSMLPFVPFNQDLNRLTLVVKGLGADKAQVTWGKQSKVFSKADLEKGVNLAAAFPVNNPFGPAFGKVDGAVAQKQAYETVMIKSFISNFPNLSKQFDNDAEANAAMDTLKAKLAAKQAKLAEQAQALVVPVKHTIKIEAAAE